MTDIQDFNTEQFTDIFGNGSLPQEQTLDKPLNFTGAETTEVDILGKVKEETEVEDVKVEEVDPGKEVDILGEDKTDSKGGRPSKYNFTDTSGYFEDRFKSGKFVAITEEREDGTKAPFIPKTPEEFDEVIDIQVNYKIDELKKNLDSDWYSSKSPAWQAVSKYAEMTDDPSEILPFIQGIKHIQDVSELNTEDIADAEKIVRLRLEQRGDDEETIEQTVESLKTTDKLVSTANKYKPAMVNEQKAELSNMINEKRLADQQYQTLVTEIRTNAIKAIEAPIFGNQKLKQDEKAAVYELIAEPSKETKGYQIYNAIDSLFEKGDFETLKQVALLLAKKESFLSYVGVTAADKAGEKLQRKLRAAVENNNGGKDSYSEETRTISRQQYSSTPKFGR